MTDLPSILKAIAEDETPKVREWVKRAYVEMTLARRGPECEVCALMLIGSAVVMLAKARKDPLMHQTNCGDVWFLETTSRQYDGFDHPLAALHAAIREMK